MLGSVAPEVLFGGTPSPASTLWTAAATCCHVLCGAPLIKTAPSARKQAQYLFATLGTPQEVGYGGGDWEAFARLPLASTYGDLLIGKVSQSVSHCILFISHLVSLFISQLAS
jgi:hypothetical protein